MPEDGSTIDIRNDALDALDALVGNWRVQIWNAGWLDDGLRAGTWSRSHDDGTTWEHDFDISWTRL